MREHLALQAFNSATEFHFAACQGTAIDICYTYICGYSNLPCTSQCNFKLLFTCYAAGIVLMSILRGRYTEQLASRSRIPSSCSRCGTSAFMNTDVFPYVDYQLKIGTMYSTEFLSNKTYNVEKVNYHLWKFSTQHKLCGLRRGKPSNAEADQKPKDSHIVGICLTRQRGCVRISLVAKRFANFWPNLNATFCIQKLHFIANQLIMDWRVYLGLPPTVTLEKFS